MKLSHLFFFFLFAMADISVMAQKLPNVQIMSLRARANLKIDGKATEWNNQFQAYNKTTEIAYILANDNDKLYLAIKATDEDVIKKAIMGGLTLTINTVGKRDIKNSVAITFPAYEGSHPGAYFIFKKSETTMASNIDSLMKLHNAKISARAKFIGVNNIEAIPDSILSVYNDNGIKVAALLDNQLNYIYELAIPLKYLKLGNSQQISYNIKINAATIDGRKLEMVPGRNIVIYTGADGVNYQLGNDPQSLALVAPTDFWSEYTLAK
jgi:hypothetical protein